MECVGMVWAMALPTLPRQASRTNAYKHTVECFASWCPARCSTHFPAIPNTSTHQPCESSPENDTTFKSPSGKIDMASNIPRRDEQLLLHVGHISHRDLLRRLIIIAVRLPPALTRRLERPGIFACTAPDTTTYHNVQGNLHELMVLHDLECVEMCWAA